MTNSDTSPLALPSQRPIALWLLACCVMVFIMALVGAVTRLTESGLSITEWRPLMGAIPPLNDLEWAKAFSDYQQIPQYQILHHGMTMDEFKGIFFWEWFHRLWGRLIGLVFAVPFVWFICRRQIDQKLILRLVVIFSVGMLQGFIGWFMVKSGLEVRTSVSPYRLALHLGFALLIYALMLRVALSLLGVCLSVVAKHQIVLGRVVLTFLVVTMVWGALVAGLHAGEAYNTWPLMEGEVFPSAALTLIPTWLNIFENLAFVQFIHRWLAPTTASLILIWSYGLCKTDKNRLWPQSVAIMALLQVLLGLSTLLSHVNIVLAVSHQAGAIILLTLVLINLWRLEKAR